MGLKKLCVWKKFGSEKNVGPKLILGRQIFQKILGRTKSWVKKNLVEKYLKDWKKTFLKKNIWVKRNLSVKKSLGRNTFGRKKSLGRKILSASTQFRGFGIPSNSFDADLSSDSI